MKTRKCNPKTQSCPSQPPVCKETPQNANRVETKPATTAKPAKPTQPKTQGDSFQKATPQKSTSEKSGSTSFTAYKRETKTKHTRSKVELHKVQASGHADLKNGNVQAKVQYTGAKLQSRVGTKHAHVKHQTVAGNAKVEIKVNAKTKKVSLKAKATALESTTTVKLGKNIQAKSTTRLGHVEVNAKPNQQGKETMKAEVTAASKETQVRVGSTKAKTEVKLATAGAHAKTDAKKRGFSAGGGASLVEAGVKVERGNWALGAGGGVGVGASGSFSLCGDKNKDGKKEISASFSLGFWSGSIRIPNPLQKYTCPTK